MYEPIFWLLLKFRLHINLSSWSNFQNFRKSALFMVCMPGKCRKTHELCPKQCFWCWFIISSFICFIHEHQLWFWGTSRNFCDISPTCYEGNSLSTQSQNWSPGKIPQCYLPIFYIESDIMCVFWCSREHFAEHFATTANFNFAIWHHTLKMLQYLQN